MTTTAMSSLWVGVDGYGTANVLQAGTEQEVFYITYPVLECRYCYQRVKISAYYPWVEWFPDYEQRITSLGVGPGDDVAVSVSVTGPIDPYHPYGNLLIWYMQNFTTGTGSNGVISAPGYTLDLSRGTCTGWCTPFTGSSAEWIMERPDYGVYDLSNFKTASITLPLAFEPQFRFAIPNPSNATTVLMYNGSTELVGVTERATGPIDFTWFAFR